MTLSSTLPAVQFDDVWYSYPSNWLGKRRQALKGINLTVEQGESFGFLGLNGAGKTTTIKSLLGLIPIEKGSISIFGIPHSHSRSRDKVGYLPEQPYFYDHLSARELVSIYASLSNVDRHIRSKRVTEVLEKVGMIERQHSRLRTFSKGQTQRIGLAQALVSHPKLLILDEPFSGLDPLGRKEFREIMGEMKREGTTIFMSSHILPDVEFLCDRVSILVKGELKGVYSIESLSQTLAGSFELVARTEAMTKEIISSLADATAEIGRLNRWHFQQRESAEKALQVILEKGGHIEHYGFQREGLENYFLKIVGESQSEA